MEQFTATKDLEQDQVLCIASDVFFLVCAILTAYCATKCFNAKELLSSNEAMEKFKGFVIAGIAATGLAFSIFQMIVDSENNWASNFPRS